MGTSLDLKTCLLSFVWFCCSNFLEHFFFYKAIIKNIFVRQKNLLCHWKEKRIKYQFLEKKLMETDRVHISYTFASGEHSENDGKVRVNFWSVVVHLEQHNSFLLKSFVSWEFLITLFSVWYKTKLKSPFIYTYHVCVCVCMLSLLLHSHHSTFPIIHVGTHRKREAKKILMEFCLRNNKIDWNIKYDTLDCVFLSLLHVFICCCCFVSTCDTVTVNFLINAVSFNIISLLVHLFWANFWWAWWRPMRNGCSSVCHAKVIL